MTKLESQFISKDRKTEGKWKKGAHKSIYALCWSQVWKNEEGCVRKGKGHQIFAKIKYADHHNSTLDQSRPRWKQVMKKKKNSKDDRWITRPQWAACGPG